MNEPHWEQFAVDCTYGVNLTIMRHKEHGLNHFFLKIMAVFRRITQTRKVYQNM